MTKEQFLSDLAARLRGIPEDDIKQSVDFYREMIEDRMDEGMSEDEAICSIGDMDEIVSKILYEVPLPKLAKERMRPKRELKAWEIVLIILGLPVWMPILIAIASIILSVYVVIWSIIITLYAISVSFAACVFGGAVVFTLCFASGRILEGIFYIGVAVFFAGMAILLFIGTNYATKGLIILSKRILLGIKNIIIGKGKNDEKIK